MGSTYWSTGRTARRSWNMSASTGETLSTTPWSCESAAARSARSSRSSSRSPASAPGSPVSGASSPLAAHSSQSRSSTRFMASRNSIRSRRGRRRKSGSTSASTTCPTTASTIRATARSVARRAPDRCVRRKTCAPAAGGGKARSTRSVACTSRRRLPRKSHSRRRTPSVLAERDHLDWLESEAIYILREVAGQCQNPVLFFSGGKDSIVLLRLAEKAFRPARFPFPLLHIDTGHNYPEVIAFRDQRAAELAERLIVRSVEDSIKRGSVTLVSEHQSRNAAQSVTLLEAIAEFQFDAAIGGARRDEEKARAKERVFSLRDEFGQWDPRNQRPELWSLYNARVNPGEHVRVFPISNWTELDVWQYIARERLEVPSIYYAHRRRVVRRRGLIVPVTPITPARPGELIEEVSVRFRTVGDISCTCPVESDALTIEKILEETTVAKLTERGATRMDDQTSDASMERRKKEGYF